MRKLFLLVLFSISLTQEYVAILDIQAMGITDVEAKILTQRLTTEFIMNGKYKVVERQNMDKILNEQKFQNSGCTDTNCAVEIGQLLNSDYIVTSSASKFGDTFAIDARMINVGTGESSLSAQYTVEGKIDRMLNEGIPSIASQLCGIESAITIEPESDEQKKNRSKKFRRRVMLTGFMAWITWGLLPPGDK